MIVVNTPELALPDDYPHLLAELKAQIRSARTILGGGLTIAQLACCHESNRYYGSRV
jgi:hypothetical protein